MLFLVEISLLFRPLKVELSDDGVDIDVYRLATSFLAPSRDRRPDVGVFGGREIFAGPRSTSGSSGSWAYGSHRSLG